MEAVNSAVAQTKLLHLRGRNNNGSLDLSMLRRSTSVCCIKFTFHSSDNGLQETDKCLELPSFSCLSSDVGKRKFAKQTHMPVKKHNQSRRTNYSAEACTYDGKVLSNASSAAQERVGVLLLNLGGPETLNDVQPFLFNLFADPARALKLALEDKDLQADVYVGMRYWHPFTEDALHQIKKDKITKLVVLPLYPQFSISTSGSSIRVLQSIIREDVYFTRLPISIIESWYQREGYINSMADLIENELLIFSKPEEVMVFFSAHGVPLSYVEDAGDPYRDQMEECIALIMDELKSRGIHNHHILAYQSRVGPVQWLKPYTDEVIVELGRRGTRSLLAVPVRDEEIHERRRRLFVTLPRLPLGNPN